MKEKESTESKILPICMEGDSILRRKCDPILPDHIGLENIIEKMHATLDASATGVGLAAPQVGLPIRLIILGGTNTRENDDGEDVLYVKKMTFINPHIIKYKGSKKKDYEGCLSVPNVRARVERYHKIKITWQDIDFVWHTQMFNGFEARVIQHEYDHIMVWNFIKNSSARIYKDRKTIGRNPQRKYSKNQLSYKAI